jgi:hypothetical protein
MSDRVTSDEFIRRWKIFFNTLTQGPNPVNKDKVIFYPITYLYNILSFFKLDANISLDREKMKRNVLQLSTI